MTTFSSKISAAILGGLLSLPNIHAATAAPCNAGDLAGKWSMYMTWQFPDVRSAVSWCTVDLINASSSPIRYDISGACRLYGADTGMHQAFQVAGSASLTESPGCKLTGTFVVTILGSPSTATILDARIDGGTPKRSITGIARIPVNPPSDYRLLSFSLQR